MKVTKVHVERTFNLGPYESLKVGFEADLAEDEKPLDASYELEFLTQTHFENRQKTKPQTPAPQAQPVKPAPPTTKTNSNVHTTCPKCGETKKPEYELCYLCWEEANYGGQNQ